MADKQKILNFLGELEKNNDRDWFNAHKKEYELARGYFIELLGELISEIQKFDPSIGPLKPKECLFRIYRDIRFSKDKAPYKTHFGAYIAKGGRKSPYAGYYIHIQDKGSMLAGGIWHPEPLVLKAIRQEIYFNLAGFNDVLGQPSFIRTFGKLIDDDKLSRPPKGYTADFEGIEYLKHKNFTVLRPLSNQSFLDEGFIDEAVSAYKELARLNAFLNRAIDMMDENQA